MEQIEARQASEESARRQKLRTRKTLSQAVGFRERDTGLILFGVSGTSNSVSIRHH